MSKIIHVKPSFYALCFYDLKDIAKRFGYNLVLHGSLNRDMDLIAIPWMRNAKPVDDMIDALVLYLGGELLLRGTNKKRYSTHPYGRVIYVINLNRGDFDNPEDPQYYLDISVTPINKEKE